MQESLLLDEKSFAMEKKCSMNGMAEFEFSDLGTSRSRKFLATTSGSNIARKKSLLLFVVV